MLQPTLHTICNMQNAGQTLLVVTAEDLMYFAHEIVQEAKRMSEPQYFTRAELMKYLNVSARTLWGYESEGLITAMKVGRKKLYNRADIYGAIEEGKLKSLKRKTS